MSIRAIIFDMDGVLTDSEKFWKASIYNLAHQQIPEFTSEHQVMITGKSLNDIFKLLQQLFPERMKQVNKGEFFDRYEKHGLDEVYSRAKMIPGALNFLHKASEKFPTALATSAIGSWASETLRRHDLRKYFCAIVTGDDVQRAKPDPEIFLRAAEMLQIPPAECLVIEDSYNGVEAGKKARMTVWGFRNGFNDEQNLKSADAIFSDFTTLKLP